MSTTAATCTATSFFALATAIEKIIDFETNAHPPRRESVSWERGELRQAFQRHALLTRADINRRALPGDEPHKAVADLFKKLTQSVKNLQSWDCASNGKKTAHEKLRTRAVAELRTLLPQGAQLTRYPIAPVPGWLEPALQPPPRTPIEQALVDVGQFHAGYNLAWRASPGGADWQKMAMDDWHHLRGIVDLTASIPIPKVSSYPEVTEWLVNVRDALVPRIESRTPTKKRRKSKLADTPLTLYFARLTNISSH